MVPGEGVEPSRYFYRRILSPLRLPFRHPGSIESCIKRSLENPIISQSRKVNGRATTFALITVAPLTRVASHVHPRQRAEHDRNSRHAVRNELQSTASRQQRYRRERDRNLNERHRLRPAMMNVHRRFAFGLELL